jgi:hypothetical protein
MAGASTGISSPKRIMQIANMKIAGSHHRKKALCFFRNARLITQGIYK